MSNSLETESVIFEKLNGLTLFVTMIIAFVIRLKDISLIPVLPGDDPLTHILSTYQALGFSRIVGPYPPLLKGLIAINILFTGVQGAQIQVLVKIITTIISALCVLPVYFIARRTFNSKSIGLLSALFIAISCRDIEILFWGGYGTAIGILFMAILFDMFLINFKTRIGRFIAYLLLSNAIILVHHITALVFFEIMFFFFIITIIVGRRLPQLDIFLALCLSTLGPGLVWYYHYRVFYLYPLSEIILNLQLMVYRQVPLNLSYFLFGTYPFLLSLVGVPISFLYLKYMHLQSLNHVLLLLSWFLVPLLQYQGQFYGQYFTRFPYYTAYPMAIFASLSLLGLSKLLLSRKIRKIALTNFKISKPLTYKTLVLTFTMVMLSSVACSQALYASQFASKATSFYNNYTWQDHSAVTWLKETFPQNTEILTTYPPGEWISLVTQRSTKVVSSHPSDYEITTPFLRILEDGPYFYSANPNIDILVDSTWLRALHFSDQRVNLKYEVDGEPFTKYLSETHMRSSYWIEQLGGGSILSSSYKDDRFSVERSVKVEGNRIPVWLNYKIKGKEDLSCVTLNVEINVSQDLYLSKALVPWTLRWGNPWDKPTLIGPEGKWALSRFPSSNLLGCDYIAFYDGKNHILVAITYDVWPEYISIRALSNHRIDTISLEYELGDVAEGQEKKAAFRVIVYPLDSQTTTDQISGATIKRLQKQEIPWEIQRWDYTDLPTRYANYIVGDKPLLPSGFSEDKNYNRIYDNGKTTIYQKK